MRIQGAATDRKPEGQSFERTGEQHYLSTIQTRHEVYNIPVPRSVMEPGREIHDNGYISRKFREQLEPSFGEVAMRGYRQAAMRRGILQRTAKSRLNFNPGSIIARPRWGMLSKVVRGYYQYHAVPVSRHGLHIF